MKFDPHKNKERWESWKLKNHSGISEISEYNSKIILKYLNDMELGVKYIND